MTGDKIIIFDTTLRDGEQSPGATMNLEEKLLIAETLDNMGVDVIEAGFAIASKGDFEAVSQISQRIKNATVCSLARATKEDIEAAAEAIKQAARPRIHTFLATSSLHMKYKLKMNESEVLEKIKESVSYAKSFVDDVDWSPEDATRTEHDFLCRTIELAIDCGATTINIPDTVGYTVPHEFYELFKMIRNRVPNIDKAILSVHCHNDLGLATANSLSAVDGGARQIECTINGIGERAGNTALEEVVMAIKTRSDILPYHTNIKSDHIIRASKLVANVTGFTVQNNKAIVGANAFAHEAGIHQDGMIKNAQTYEIMTPESIGLKKSNLILGKHSGRAAFKDKVSDLGFELGDNSFEDVFVRFKELADKKKKIYDDDIIALIDDQITKGENNRVKLYSLHVDCGTRAASIATLELIVDGEKKSLTMDGDGPVDAIFKTIKELVPHQAKLELYQVSAVTEGIDAQAEVSVRLKTPTGLLLNGAGSDTDTLVASTLAYITALNKLINYEEKIVPQGSLL